MQVLVVGSGGREHALGWRLKRSPRVDAIHSCPGNAGLAGLGQCWEGIDPARDFDALIARIRKERIDLVVVGPETPLVAGLADRLRQERIPTFGPNQVASQLEGSKAHSKQFMARNGIPTARFEIIENTGDLRRALSTFEGPVVVKASGLAAGKGVVLTDDHAEAEKIARGMLAGDSFGDAGHTVVLEEKLGGVEMTMLVFVSGSQYQLLQSAQDYKPLEEGNRGPNTGGMGAYSPTHLLTDPVRERVLSDVLLPTLKGLEKDDVCYQGLLYLGLMLTGDGPQVLEYNVRFGDPEAQPVLMRLKTDLIDVFEAIDGGTLDQLTLEWDPRAAVCVVLATQGYPGPYPKGLEITGPSTSELDDPVQVFHAGTTLDGDRLVTSGGRVIGVTALGDTLESARASAFERAAKINWDGRIYRRDIAG